MLTSVLALVLGLLVVFGIVVSITFRSLYLTETRNRLVREVDDINEIVVTRYIDMDKRPAAREELKSIVRLYDAYLQLCFDDVELGRYSAYGDDSGARWGTAEEADLDAYIEAVHQGTDEGLYYGLLTRYTGFYTLTAMRPITTEEGEELGVIFFHYDMTGVNSSIRSALSKVMLFCGIAIAVSVPLIMLLVRSVTDPISHMTEVVKDYGRGNLDRRVEVKGTDELSNLGASFNSMADGLSTLENARRSFVANVSHELRSPLTSMRGFLEAMADGTIAPEERDQYIAIVLDENRRMTVMVNDLLDLARIESGQYKLSMSDFDLNELMRRTVITFLPRIGSKRIHLEILIGEEPLFVMADPQRITQVLHNLIDNGIKYTTDGGFLRIESRQERHIARVLITNSGSGIPKEALPHVFDRFYKAELAHTPTGTSGTGLGLSIAKLILNQHGQEISVSSDEGVTCFSFTLALGVKPSARKEQASPQASKQHDNN